MSRETDVWLNTYTLIGFTDQRGTAWHYREDLQGTEPNHYPGAVPVDDVLRRLFNWEPLESEVYVPGMDGGYVAIPGRKAIRRDDSGDVLGIFKEGYQGHSYREWLVENVGSILDADLQIGSAGLLKNGAQAWVSVEMPETLHAADVAFRPHLLATTSFDGSLATTYGRKVQLVVCDNTLSVALGEQGEQFKLKHTKYSGMKLTDAREALAIVHSMAADFTAEVERLTAWKVTDKQFFSALDALVPVPKDEGRGLTVATKKRDEVIALYRNDERAASWNGTAFGVLQAFNTWNQHTAQVRKGVPRVVRNMENVAKGKTAEQDAAVLDALTLVCA